MDSFAIFLFLLIFLFLSKKVLFVCAHFFLTTVIFDFCKILFTKIKYYCSSEVAFLIDFEGFLQNTSVY